MLSQGNDAKQMCSISGGRRAEKKEAALLLQRAAAKTLEL